MRLFKPDFDKPRALNDVDGLIEALDDTSAEVRIKTAYALGNLGNRRAVEGLIECLVDTYGRVRKESALARGKLCNQRAVEALVAALDDEHERTRGRADSC
jgi:HEAT repeat protein